MRKLVLLTAALAAAVLLLVLAATLPPAPLTATGAAGRDLLPRTLPGAYHVHTTVSDGSADRRTIAAAASRVGLRFVIFTDHGDGTREPAAPEYVDGVLCIDGVEISTDQGHYVALDMPASPYPLGGAAAAVAEDVRRLGGFGVAAHPDSPKEALRWTDWSVPIDGIEWLNADSEWRDESWLDLLRTPFHYLVRPGPALARLLDRPDATLARWDWMSAVRPLVGLAAHDAHGGLGRGWNEDGESRVEMPVPSYGASFRTFAVRVVVDRAPSGHAAADARLLLDAVRAGRVFTAIDALASPAWLEFRAVVPAGAAMGDSVPYERGSRLRATSALTSGSTIALLCNGREVAASSTGEVEGEPPGPGACRVEVRLERSPGTPAVPWIVSSPIHLQPARSQPFASDTLLETVPLGDAAWVVESDPESKATLDRGAAGFTLGFQLRSGARGNQYVAAVTPIAPLTEYQQVVFTAETDRPMRVSVQLRLGAEERWVRSVYLEREPRRIAVPFSTFRPVAGTAPPLESGRTSSLLFVVDLTNARPGHYGTLRVTDVAFAR